MCKLHTSKNFFSYYCTDLKNRLKPFNFDSEVLESKAKRCKHPTPKKVFFVSLVHGYSSLFTIVLCCWYAYYQSSFGASNSCLNPHDSPYPSVSIWLSILLAWIKNLLAPLGTCKHGAKQTHVHWKANSYVKLSKDILAILSTDR